MFTLDALRLVQDALRALVYQTTFLLDVFFVG